MPKINVSQFWFSNSGSFINATQVESTGDEAREAHTGKARWKRSPRGRDYCNFSNSSLGPADWARPARRTSQMPQFAGRNRRIPVSEHARAVISNLNRYGRHSHRSFSRGRPFELCTEFRNNRTRYSPCESLSPPSRPTTKEKMVTLKWIGMEPF